jgi:hypothetical protein
MYCYEYQIIAYLDASLSFVICLAPHEEEELRLCKPNQGDAIVFIFVGTFTFRLSGSVAARVTSKQDSFL